MRRVPSSPGCPGLSALALCLLASACTSTPTGHPGQSGTAGAGASGSSGSNGGAGNSGSAGSAGSAGGGGGGGSNGGAGASGGAAPAGSAGNGDASADSAVTSTGGSGGNNGTDGGAAGVTGGQDAGGVGGFGFSGASRCASSGALLCESFENGLDATVWTQLIGGTGTATVDEVHAFRGTKALHIAVVGTTGHKAAISETKTFPIANNILYARMFIWFDTFTTGAHFTMAEAPQTAAGAWIRFGGQGGKYGVGTDHGASGDWLQQDTAPVPTKQWTCIEFELKSDTNEFHVWQDDVERTALNVGAKQHNGFVMPPFTSLWFGWQTYSNQAPGELWIDEIAIDSKPIGCAK
jgi:hypothetical protein